MKNNRYRLFQEKMIGRTISDTSRPALLKELDSHFKKSSQRNSEYNPTNHIVNIRS